MDIESLADQSVMVARLHRLRMPAAVRLVLRERGLFGKPHDEEIVSSVCRELQKRSAARRKKNNQRSERVIADMFAAQVARGGDPND